MGGIGRGERDRGEAGAGEGELRWPVTTSNGSNAVGAERAGERAVWAMPRGVARASGRGWDGREGEEAHRMAGRQGVFINVCVESGIPIQERVRASRASGARERSGFPWPHRPTRQRWRLQMCGLSGSLANAVRDSPSPTTPEDEEKGEWRVAENARGRRSGLCSSPHEQPARRDKPNEWMYPVAETPSRHTGEETHAPNESSATSDRPTSEGEGHRYRRVQAAMVTSTSTPDSIDIEVCARASSVSSSERRRAGWKRTICLTTSAGDSRSMRRLWIFISSCSPGRVRKRVSGRARENVEVKRRDSRGPRSSNLHRKAARERE